MNHKTVLITGASRGIGKATALAFAKSGYNTVITCKNSADDLLALAETINEMTPAELTCLPIVSDMANPLQVEAMFDKIHETFSGVDILINNAGISHYGLVSDTSIHQWQEVINTNLNGAFYACKQALPYMIKQKSGSIVNISSIWGTYGASMEVAYSTSKAGLNGLTKSLAREVGPSNIRVNAIACGAIQTEMNSRFTEDEMTAFTEDIALCRMGTTDEVAKMIVHTATEATYMTGEILHYDGGY